MIDISAASDLVAVMAGLVAIAVAGMHVAVVHIRGKPARLLAQAELERAKAGLPSGLEARLFIDLKEKEAISPDRILAALSRFRR